MKIRLRAIATGSTQFQCGAKPQCPSISSCKFDKGNFKGVQVSTNREIHLEVKMVEHLPR
jgi:hypothetical protein